MKKFILLLMIGVLTFAIGNAGLYNPFIVPGNPSGNNAVTGHGGKFDNYDNPGYLELGITATFYLAADAYVSKFDSSSRAKAYSYVYGQQGLTTEAIATSAGVWVATSAVWSWRNGSVSYYNWAMALYSCVGTTAIGNVQINW